MTFSSCCHYLIWCRCSFCDTFCCLSTFPPLRPPEKHLHLSKVADMKANFYLWKWVKAKLLPRFAGKKRQTNFELFSREFPHLLTTRPVALFWDPWLLFCCLSSHKLYLWLWGPFHKHVFICFTHLCVSSNGRDAWGRVKRPLSPI